MVKPDISTELSGIRLSNPVIPASGTFGFGKEFAELYDINILGSISVKGTTREPRFGNPQPRIAECPMGLINSVGLQNPGIDEVVKKELPELSEIYHKPVIANISGFSVDEYVECAEAVDKVENVGIIEVNVSCPNVHAGGMAFGTSAENIAKVTKAVKAVAKKPVYIKLSPNVTDITEMAKAAESEGADGLSLINTLMGMRIDVMRRRPVIANKMGGFSGPAILPVAVRMVYQVANAVKLPIIGMGGIATAEDALEFIMAGATAVSVGTANFYNPYATVEIADGIEKFMKEQNVEDIRELIGAVKEL